MSAPVTKWEFPAEIKTVSSKKLVSGDIEYRLVLDTPEPNVLNLGVIDADMLVDITVELQKR